LNLSFAAFKANRIPAPKRKSNFCQKLFLSTSPRRPATACF